jgi:hypothetical protein
MKNILGCAMLMLLAGSVAAEEPAEKSSTLGFKSGGYVYWENYRLWAADYGQQTYKGDWFNSILGGFVLENQMSEQLRTRVALESRFYRPFPDVPDKEESRFTKSSTYLHEAKAVYAFGQPQAPTVEVEVGYFLYDYNKDQHNLGEYLFRSKIYPINLFTDFELPMDRLLGIRLGNTPFKGFHHDLLLTSEYKYYPKSDFSVSYVAAYNLGGVLEIGAGVDFHHLIPVRPSLETPQSVTNKDQNTYVQIPVQSFTDANGVQKTLNQPVEGFLQEVQSQNDSLTYQPVGATSLRLLEGLKRTETHYSYQGIKLMGRASFDPKPLMGSPAIMGKDDLKIYGEVAVLGLKNYPGLYNDIKERMPVMVGVNVPCFNFLDVLGVEFEYMAYPWPNDWKNSLRPGVPQPGNESFSYSSWSKKEGHKDDWKWSVYLRKQLARGLFVSAQAACDHLRLPDKQDFTYESVMKDTGKPFSGQWWGIFRVTASY